MYRLLIVDDEIDIVEWLYNLFYNVQDMELDIYRVYSAVEALRVLESTKIDIVLSDIHMPGMNGLQMLEKIHDSWPWCRIIFLTGYHEFDYAYKAIQYNVSGYILKTEDDDVILKAVDKAIAEIENEMRSQELVNKARQMFSLSLPYRKGEYLADLVTGGVTAVDTMKLVFKELEIELNEEYPVLLLLGRVDSMEGSLIPSKRSEILLSVKVAAETYLPASISFTGFTVDSSTMLWLIQPKSLVCTTRYEEDMSKAWSSIFEKIYGSLEIIQAACRASLDISVSFAAAHQFIGWENLKDKYLQLKLLLSKKFNLCTGVILTDRSFSTNDEGIRKDNEKILKALTRLNCANMLEAYLESGQQREFMDLLSEIVECLKEAEVMSYYPAMEIYYSIALMFVSYINRCNLTESLNSQIGLDKLLRVDEHNGWAQAVKYLYDLANTLFGIQTVEEENRISLVIADVQKYINEHLGGDISLARLSDTVYLNPSYLSRLFKQVTGTNISSYIFDMRISKAKELLSNSYMKNHEIASAIGFDSAEYFARFFKKAINMTPQQYRERHITKK